MDDRHSQRIVRGRTLCTGLLAAVLLTATAVALQWNRPADPQTQPPVAAITLGESAAVPAELPESPPDDVDDTQPSALAERLVGVWRLQRHGERTLQVHADGTAIADVKLNMLGALMYGAQLQLQLDWSLEGDVMTQTIVSGTPEEPVQRLIRDWGDRREYRVMEATDEQLVLDELGDDGDRDVWTSVPSVSPATASETKQSPR